MFACISAVVAIVTTNYLPCNCMDGYVFNFEGQLPRRAFSRVDPDDTGVSYGLSGTPSDRDDDSNAQQKDYQSGDANAAKMTTENLRKLQDMLKPHASDDHAGGDGFGSTSQQAINQWLEHLHLSDDDIEMEMRMPKESPQSVYDHDKTHGDIKPFDIPVRIHLTPYGLTNYQKDVTLTNKHIGIDNTKKASFVFLLNFNDNNDQLKVGLLPNKLNDELITPYSFIAPYMALKENHIFLNEIAITSRDYQEIMQNSSLIHIGSIKNIPNVNMVDLLLSDMKFDIMEIYILFINDISLLNIDFNGKNNGSPLVWKKLKVGNTLNVNVARLTTNEVIQYMLKIVQEHVNIDDLYT